VLTLADHHGRQKDQQEAELGKRSEDFFHCYGLERL
jgi:hypothetical protein